MFKQNSKYRIHFLVLIFVLMIIGAIFNFNEFYQKKDGMKMIGGIILGIAAIVYAYDLFEYIKNKKRLNS